MSKSVALAKIAKAARLSAEAARLYAEAASELDGGCQHATHPDEPPKITDFDKARARKALRRIGYGV